MAVKHYKLARRYWNGKVEFKRGHIEPFEEGNQPPGAVEVAEPELVEKGSDGAGPTETKAKK